MKPTTGNIPLIEETEFDRKRKSERQKRYWMNPPQEPECEHAHFKKEISHEIVNLPRNRTTAMNVSDSSDGQSVSDELLFLEYSIEPSLNL